MTSTFNLLDEPWIKVVRINGTQDEVSLLTVFAEAETIAGVHGEIASQDFAILRLLLAICHRAMEGPADLDAWIEHWDDPSTLGEAAASYLMRYRDRFDLRHPTHPFFQVAGIHAASGKTSGLESLVVDVPNGHPFFTTRISEGLDRMTWAEAARWLIHVHAFDPSGIRSGAVGDPQVKGGKGYPIGPGWTGQIGGIHLEGSNLARTLLLNTTATELVPDLEDVDPDADLPPWERDQDGPAGTADLPLNGPVTCYTWQTRRVLLHGDDTFVTGLFLGNGDKATPQNRYSSEPMTAWRYSDPQTKKFRATVFMPRKHPTDQAFWRGLPSLVSQLSPTVSVKGKEVTRYRSPGVVVFYQELMRRRITPNSGLIPLHAVGITYGAQEAVVTELVDDALSLPAALLDPDSQESRRLAVIVRDAMEETEQVAYALRRLASNLDLASGGSPDTASAAGDRARAAFYQVIDEEFPRWLALLDERDPNRSREEWRDYLRREALRQQNALANTVPETAFAGRGEGNGRMDVSRALLFFRLALTKVLPRPPSSASSDHRTEGTPA
ncbi:type I-E CRISPR-associated protein Cse1/CasA [Actinomyces slackii]|uniref:Cascade antiviral complex protein n=1 Tax=Actinomyces slackii TaxID=52774 RepID=A0A3S4WKA3_9ACTO|nr:type I-E CRISPR-associated protein Cse1/CasA [Actinomyces slackii]VEG74735.1 Cascade antiviral complex protein [Actinomyces slackii]